MNAAIRPVGDYYATGQDAWLCDDCEREEISCTCDDPDALTQEELISDGIAALQNEGFHDEAAAIIAIRAEVALCRSLAVVVADLGRGQVSA